jgi:zinc-finger-containing domain
MTDPEPTCPYCSKPAKLATGEEVYPHRRDLASLFFWACLRCNAWVSCHKGSDEPMGTLADARVRHARWRAHEYLDPLWQTSPANRSEVYEWLSEQMRIPLDECHIALFTEKQCDEVVRIVVTKRKDFEEYADQCEDAHWDEADEDDLDLGRE